MYQVNNVFVFAYYSYKDPVFQSAVLPYLINFSGNYKFIILTFEQKQYQLTDNEFSKIKNDLETKQIILYRTKWHSGRFKIFKKGYDFMRGILLSQYLILKHNIRVIYSEGFPGSVISHYLSKLNNCPHVIHSFEPHAEYMLDAGVWLEKSWEYMILKKLEIKVANGAATLFTATNAYRNILLEKGVTSQIVQIPSCVDTEFFAFSEKDRLEKRKHLGINEDDILICYLGKFGGMYMDSEVFNFYKLCLQHSEKFKLLIISVDDAERIYQFAALENISRHEFHLVKLERKEIPAFLSASDWGFVAVKPLPSKRYCSPIKTGEYWANGLPVIIPEGVSDDFELVKNNNLGVSFNSFDVRLAKEIYDKSYSTYNRDKIKSFGFKNRDIGIYKKLLKTTLSNLLPTSLK